MCLRAGACEVYRRWSQTEMVYTWTEGGERTYRQNVAEVESGRRRGGAGGDLWTQRKRTMEVGRLQENKAQSRD